MRTAQQVDAVSWVSHRMSIRNNARQSAFAVKTAQERVFVQRPASRS